jgi:hypothetical protein
LDELLSDTEEALIGHGKTYNFIIHPVLNKLVWAGTGTMEVLTSNAQVFTKLCVNNETTIAIY